MVVLITDAGRDLIEGLYAQGREELAPATDRLDPHQRHELARLLEPLLSPPLPLTPRRPAGRTGALDG